MKILNLNTKIPHLVSTGINAFFFFINFLHESLVNKSRIGQTVKFFSNAEPKEKNESVLPTPSI